MFDPTNQEINAENKFFGAVKLQSQTKI